jgi:hypothetical protein
MLNALIPCSLSSTFSALSTSLRPIYTSFRLLTFISSLIHPNISSSSSLAKPVRNATGIPWIFPEPDISGVLISACASTQINAISRPSLSRIAFADPATDPIAILWSPPRVSTQRPATAWV